jgi:phospholipid/cholesterol/gamma-HCH transport system substrate-binding protein
MRRLPLGKLALFTAGCLVLWAVLIFSLNNTNFRPMSSYHAMFSDVSGLRAGDTVRVAGVVSGRVTAVDLHGFDVDVSFSVSHDQTLTTTTRAVIRYETLLGQRYLALVPGAAGGAPLQAGATIAKTHTMPALDLTSLLNGFQPLFSALAPKQINELMGSIVQVLQGEAGATTDLVSQLASLTGDLADRQRVIGAVVDNLATVARTVGRHDAELDRAISRFNTIATGIADNKGALAGAIDNTTALTRTVNHLFRASQPALNTDISGIAKYSKTLAANQAVMGRVIRKLPGLLTFFTRFTSSGSWLQVYICALDTRVVGNAPVPGTGIPLPVKLKFPQGPVGDQSVDTRSCT